jgi:hypothetical protein
MKKPEIENLVSDSLSGLPVEEGMVEAYSQSVNPFQYE